MRPPTVVGVDLSLTATGVAAGSGCTTLRCATTGIKRLLEVRDAVLAICRGVALVAVEGYSFGSRTSHAYALGELGGFVRVSLYEGGIRYVDVPPASLKKYATGRGNAKKEDVLVAAVRRLNYQGADHNQADALWLRALALDGLGHPIVTVPQTHRAALKPIDWDALRKEASDG